MASELSDPSDLTPSTDGNDVQKLLGSIADRAKEDKFLYTKFFAIGLFRLLELTGKQAWCMLFASQQLSWPADCNCVDSKQLCLGTVTSPSTQDESSPCCNPCMLC